MIIKIIGYNYKSTKAAFIIFNDKYKKIAAGIYDFCTARTILSIRKPKYKEKVLYKLRDQDWNNRIIYTCKINFDNFNY